MIGRWWRRGEDDSPEPEPVTPPLDKPAPDGERLTPQTPRFEAPPLETPPEYASPEPAIQPDEAQPAEMQPAEVQSAEMQPAAIPAPAPDMHDQFAALAAKIDGLAAQISRMAREQLRANEIGERALREARELAALARAAAERPSPAVRELRFPAGRAAPLSGVAIEPAGEQEQKALRVLESLMPVLDAVEAGLESGRAQLDHLDDAEARTLLAAWLDGQRLLRERVLALFEREGIRPMDALGQRFNPFRHVAVERTFDPLRVPGTIVSERRRGYELGERVLRFAEVIVTTDRPENGQ